MSEQQQKVDVTELASLGEQFPLRLVQLGFRFMQVVDAAGREDLRQQHAFKVLRGGSYHRSLRYARVARRYLASPAFTYYYVGARLVGEGIAG